jgi:Protein of unknown function (DUF4199)
MGHSLILLSIEEGTIMGRIIWVYGTIAGIILASSFGIGYLLNAGIDDHNPITGYLIMLVALGLVFVGVKRYRDTVQGGVVRFWSAFGVGLGIAGVASLFYVLGWEAYMYATNYSFMDAYIQSLIAAKQAAGAAPAEIAKFTSEMNAFKADYAKPLYRMTVTLSEIAPIGLIVALISAALLRNSRFLPLRKTES